MNDRTLENEQIEKERGVKIYKADELLQKARFSLTLTEQRIILYSISKIQPTDTGNTFYDINLGDFFKVCGINHKESYTEIKDRLRTLANKGWWLKIGKEDSLVRWFTTVRISEQSGTIRVKFHEDMFPYLFELAKQMRLNGTHYTSYEFQYVLPMKSTYSIRLYELLKSYQKNNQRWWFKIDDLKRLLDCTNYTRYADFRRFALEPAIKEINLYTDLSVEAQTLKLGRKIDTITFIMSEKDFTGKLKAHQRGLTELDGEIHYWDFIKNDATEEVQHD